MTAALALTHREILRFVRQPSRIAGAVVPPLMAWILLGSGFGSSLKMPTASASTPYLAYFYPGTVVLVVLFASIFSNISIIEDRKEGFLQGVLVSPVSPVSLVLGKVLGAGLLAMIQGAALLLLAPLLVSGLTPGRLLAALGVLALLSLALAGLGFSVAWPLDSTQGFHGVMNMFLIPMWVLSGSFFPREGAPAWLAAAMALNPLTYGVAAFREVLTPGVGGLPPLAISLAVTAGFAVAAFLLPVLLVRHTAGPR
ncbi:MAG: ABC transporter permease [Acidobacteria bacterium]|nr:ABC transporter permease [Acidobacteriota bacterium]MCG3192408.1 Daunorubicin/doxorubicin resistance ABC transporter permease protein DrrB [Thermoanaerobaculia bacterium]MCK6682075.1 ABC transporter permease [Thermoanaerobaculia bacterium]